MIEIFVPSFCAWLKSPIQLLTGRGHALQQKTGCAGHAKIVFHRIIHSSIELFPNGLHKAAIAHQLDIPGT